MHISLIEPPQFVVTPQGRELLMGDVLRFEPTAPDSSASHSLKIHIENARQRREMRELLAEFQRMSTEQPLAAALFLHWVIDVIRDMQT